MRASIKYFDTLVLPTPYTLLHTIAIMSYIEQQSPETLLSVAAKITEYAQKLTKELEAGKVPPVTLEADSPIKYESLPGNSFLIRQQLEDVN